MIGLPDHRELLRAKASTKVSILISLERHTRRAKTLGGARCRPVIRKSASREAKV
jgi:hypothetical protein